jgi:hypothetical protein
MRKNHEISCFESAGCSLLRAEGFSCSLDVLGISKLQFLIKKLSKIFYSCTSTFFQFWVRKPWIRIRIGIQPKMLDRIWTQLIWI